jgi:Ran GTPase-activating protein (RanGAP) involved in mRNA processing and transport
MVTQDAFMANTALERVEITDNPKLEEISIDSFSHLHNLKHLSLNNNSLLVSLL